MLRFVDLLWFYINITLFGETGCYIRCWSFGVCSYNDSRNIILHYL